MDQLVNEKYKRTKLLFGENFVKILNARVLLLGVGGVGGFCLDCLSRTGVGDITIVDRDIFETSNQNRQIGSEFIGESKVKVLSKIYSNTTPIHTWIDTNWIQNHDFDKYDIVIDAIDDVPSKIALACKVSKKLISSMGSAKRIDPSKIKISSIWKTQNDPLAKKIRYELKKSNFRGNFDVVYSEELPKCLELGSFSGVTGSFGLMLASMAIQKIINMSH